MSGVGGATFRGDPNERERKYQLIRELISTCTMTLKQACKQVGMSTQYYSRLQKEKHDVSLVKRGAPKDCFWRDL